MARARTAPPREVPVDCSSSNISGNMVLERDATRRREGAFMAPGRAELTPVATRNVTFLDARPGPGRLVPLAITVAASLIKFLVLRRPPVTWPLGTLRPRPAEIRRHSRCACAFLGEELGGSGTTTREHSAFASRNACARRVVVQSSRSTQRGSVSISSAGIPVAGQPEQSMAASGADDARIDHVRRRRGPVARRWRRCARAARRR